MSTLQPYFYSGKTGLRLPPHGFRSATALFLSFPLSLFWWFGSNGGDLAYLHACVWPAGRGAAELQGEFFDAKTALGRNLRLSQFALNRLFLASSAQAGSPGPHFEIHRSIFPSSRLTFYMDSTLGSADAHFAPLSGSESFFPTNFIPPPPGDISRAECRARLSVFLVRNPSTRSDRRATSAYLPAAAPPPSPAFRLELCPFFFCSPSRMLNWIALVVFFLKRVGCRLLAIPSLPTEPHPSARRGTMLLRHPAFFPLIKFFDFPPPKPSSLTLP